VVHDIQRLAVGVEPGQVPEVLHLIGVELDKLRSGGITAEELDVAVGYLTGAYVMGLEDTGSRMARLGALLTTTGAVRPVAEQVERWRAVTVEDVQRVAATYLVPQNRCRVWLVPAPRRAS